MKQRKQTHIRYIQQTVKTNLKFFFYKLYRQDCVLKTDGFTIKNFQLRFNE